MIFYLPLPKAVIGPLFDKVNFPANTYWEINSVHGKDFIGKNESKCMYYNSIPEVRDVL